MAPNKGPWGRRDGESMPSIARSATKEEQRFPWWASLSFVDTVLCGARRVMIRLGRSRAEISDGRVEPLSTFEHLDIVEERGSELGVRGPSSSPDELGLARAEERLRNRVIPAIAFAAHADLDAGFGEGTLISVARILAAAIRVVQQAFRGPAMEFCHGESSQRELG